MLQAKETFEEIKTLTKIYIRKLRKYKKAQFIAKKDKDTWSLGQMYEHLLAGSEFFRFNIENCLNQENGSLGGCKNDTGEEMYKLGAFPPIKINIPKEYRGEDPEARPKSHYPLLFQKELDEFEKTLDSIESDKGEYTTFHMACGMLTAMEWLKMAEMHLRHHLRQQANLEEIAKELVTA